MCQEEIQELLDKLGIDELNESQKKVIEDGFLEAGNHVVSLPMGSGKSLLAYIKFMDSDGPHFYIAPTRAIAEQKYKELKNIFGRVSKVLGGDFVMNKITSDIVVTTPEKFVSLWRRGKIDIGHIGVMVFDEAHILADNHRGTNYEMLISALNFISYCDNDIDIDLVLMSGTIYNHDVVSEWLDAIVYHASESEDLREHLVARVDWDLIHLINPESGETVSGIPNDGPSPIISIVKDYYLNTKKKILVICKTRGQTKEFADDLVSIVGKGGIYYHHRGLDGKEKELVEQKCMTDDYRVIFSTTTFAMGIDYTFDMVILTFTKLYDRIYEWEEQQEINTYMILTLHQISRRSGHKPGMKSLSIAVGDNFDEGMQIYENTFRKFPPVESKLYLMQGLMKMQEWFVHLIVTGYINTLDELLVFIGKSFYIRSGEDMEELYPNIREFLLNPWVNLSSDEYNLEEYSVDEILDDEDMHYSTRMEVSDCLIKLTEKGWSPKLIIFFIWYTYDIFKNNIDNLDNINKAEILKYLIKADLHLVIEMRKMRAFDHVRRSEYNTVDYFFDGLQIIDILLPDNTLLNNQDKQIWDRIILLTELANKCMSKQIINPFIDEDANDRVNKAINEFKMNPGVKSAMMMVLYHIFNNN